MIQWYQSGKSTGDISLILSSPEWQEYWVTHSGSEFRPHKVSVCVVLRQSGCQIRNSSERSKGRHPAKKPWPIEEMIRLYNDGMSLEELAAHLSADAYQPYWIERIGSEYRPGQKIVNKVLKKHCQLRGRGAPGSRNGSWKGGVRVDKDGYVLVYCPDHPHAAENGCVREHRLVMEKKIGRYLSESEVVHHKDDNKANNHPDNLELFESNSKHISETTCGLRRRRISVSNARRAAMQENPELRSRYDGLVQRMAAEGLPIRKIAELMDCHKGTVARNIERIGCSRNLSRSGATPDDLREECRRFLATLDQSIRDGQV